MPPVSGPGGGVGMGMPPQSMAMGPPSLPPHMQQQQMQQQQQLPPLQPPLQQQQQQSPHGMGGSSSRKGYSPFATAGLQSRVSDAFPHFMHPGGPSRVGVSDPGCMPAGGMSMPMGGAAAPMAMSEQQGGNPKLVSQLPSLEMLNTDDLPAVGPIPSMDMKGSLWGGILPSLDTEQQGMLLQDMGLSSAMLPSIMLPSEGVGRLLQQDGGQNGEGGAARDNGEMDRALSLKLSMSLDLAETAPEVKSSA